MNRGERKEGEWGSEERRGNGRERKRGMGGERRKEEMGDRGRKTKYDGENG